MLEQERVRHSSTVESSTLESDRLAYQGTDKSTTHTQDTQVTHLQQRREDDAARDARPVAHGRHQLDRRRRVQT
jgi:hypothetical protein